MPLSALPKVPTYAFHDRTNPRECEAIEGIMKAAADDCGTEADFPQEEWRSASAVRPHQEASPIRENRQGWMFERRIDTRFPLFHRGTPCL
jgi:hypothetical protein